MGRDLWVLALCFLQATLGSSRTLLPNDLLTAARSIPRLAFSVKALEDFELIAPSKSETARKRMSKRRALPKASASDDAPSDDFVTAPLLGTDTDAGGSVGERRTAALLATSSIDRAAVDEDLFSSEEEL